jgi:hypothetical protein
VCSTSLSAFNRRSICKRRLNFLPLHTAQVFGCVISTTNAALLKLLLLGGALPGKGGVTTSTTTCMWSKRCQRLNCKGPIGTRYVSTETHRPQGSVRGRTFDTSIPTRPCRIRGRALEASWSRCLELQNSQDMQTQTFQIFPQDICLPKFLKIRNTQRSYV